MPRRRDDLTYFSIAVGAGLATLFALFNRKRDLRGPPPAQSFAQISLGESRLNPDIPAPQGPLDEMILIQDMILTVAGNPSFLNIPQVYRHLRLYVIARSAAAATSDSTTFRVNNDTTANYDYLFITNNTATTVIANEQISKTLITAGTIPAGMSAPNYFGFFVIEIGDYTSIHSKPITVKQGAVISSASGNLFTQFTAGMWRGTAPVTEIDFQLANFDVGSRLTLYGVI